MKHSITLGVFLYAIFMLLNIPYPSTAIPDDPVNMEGLILTLSDPLKKADIIWRGRSRYQKIELINSMLYARWDDTLVWTNSHQKDGIGQYDRTGITQSNADNVVIGFERAKSYARSQKYILGVKNLQFEVEDHVDLELLERLCGFISTLKMQLKTFTPAIKRAGCFDVHFNTSFLLNATYKFIRKFLCKCNLGVSSDLGLIDVIGRLEKFISSPGKIVNQVIETGFSIRLKKSIETAHSKEIKELIIYAIKQVAPSKVIIEVCQNDDVFNSLLFDDNRGVDSNHWANCIRLNGIRYKINQTGGEMTIDSTFGFGTGTIINIPLL